MKKILFYTIFIAILIFTMPIIFTNKFQIEEVSSKNYEEFDYGKYNEIKILHVENGEVEKINLDTYLLGVVASEMPVNFDIEALKAQAVVARTYTIYQIEHGGKHGELADICDSSTCCQAWISKENRMARWEENERESNWEKIEKAVNETAGKLILYEGKPINALFHSNSGGKTEVALDVWGGDYPYFQSIETFGEENYTSYKSEAEFSRDELIKIMHEKYDDFYINFDDTDCIKIIDYTNSGRVKTIQIGNKVISGVDARILFNLKSTNFDFNIIDNKIIFYVIGYGHGVGLSQCGSDYLAKNGKKFDEIIKYYYKNVEISE